MIFWMFFYLPVLLAFYVMATHYKQISTSWILVLLFSLPTGGAPLVALLFLASSRKLLDEVTQPIPNTTLTTPTTATSNPPSGEFAVNVTPQPSTTVRRTGSVLSSVVGGVLMIFGMFAVGVFVLVTVVAIQCANDPKCI